MKTFVMVVAAAMAFVSFASGGVEVPTAKFETRFVSQVTMSRGKGGGE